MPAPPTVIASASATLPDAAQARLQELAQSLQARAKRMAGDIYWQGRDLLEAKALFGRGQNSAFLAWARQSAQVHDTLIYRFMQVAQAFPEFSDQDFEVVATALYAIASPTTPEAARVEFLQRSRRGEVVSLPDAKAIVQRYSSQQDDRFERYRQLVQPWGNLQQSHDPVLDQNQLHLLTIEGETKVFRHYTDLKQAFLDWRKATFMTDLQTVQALVAPHWSVRPAPVPSQPFRLEVECQISGLSKALVVKNPRLLIEWWYRQGQELSDRLAAVNPETANPETANPETANLVATALATAPRQLLDSLQPSQFLAPTCLTCSWREAAVSVGPEEFWCGFYRTAFGLDQAEVRPQICRKWQPLGRLNQMDDGLQITERRARSSPRLPDARSGALLFVPDIPAALPQRAADFSALLDQIATLTEAELDLLQRAIDQRRSQNATAATLPSRIASPV